MFTPDPEVFGQLFSIAEGWENVMCFAILDPGMLSMVDEKERTLMLLVNWGRK